MIICQLRTIDFVLQDALSRRAHPVCRVSTRQADNARTAGQCNPNTHRACARRTYKTATRLLRVGHVGQVSLPTLGAETAHTERVTLFVPSASNLPLPSLWLCKWAC